MKAILINTNLDILQAETLHQAYEMHANLTELDPRAGWTVMAPPITTTKRNINSQYEKLENLYALAASLLIHSGRNPLEVTINVPQMDKADRKVTAVTIFREGRLLIDEMHNKMRTS